MTSIVHLTDLHFGATDPAVVAALIEDVNADPPDLVAVSGDLTQGARLSEFRAARDFLDKLRAPTLAVPGNHDLTPYNLGERFLNPYHRWRHTVALETEPEWRGQDVAVVGLNTARRLGLNWDWSRGRVTARRLSRLLERLEALPDGVARVVVAHHPLLPPENAPSTPVAGGATRALAAMAKAGVRLILAGHLHRGFTRLAQPVTGHPAPMILQGATSTSTRLRGEPNAYARIVFSEDGTLTVAARVWDGQAWVGKSVASETR